MTALSPPIPKRKSHQAATRWLQILSVLADAFTPQSKDMNTMFIQNPTSKHNQILGVIPGAALPLARSHRDKALRDYQITPTITKWRKLTEACQRLNHVHALTSQQRGII